jgi:hypothetical protein
LLGVLVTYGAVAFGWRSWRQWRRTGSTGFRGIGGRIGSAEWVGGALFVVAIVLAAAAPIVAAAELDPIVEPTPIATANPIFASMLALLGGEALVLSTLVGASAFAVALVAIEIQVRLVEEPYLLKTHGDAYRRYAARVGRFVPWIGRVRAQAPPQAVAPARAPADR